MTGLDPIKLATFRQLSEHTEVLIPETTVAVPAAVIMTNAGRLGFRKFECSMLYDTYRARLSQFPSVTLTRLPRGATVLGAGSHWLLVEGVLAAEQVNPLTTDLTAGFAALRALPFATVEVAAPCLLVARYGAITWGHWVGELLPRAILAELAYPGRFIYAVPDEITTVTAERSYSSSVLESLAAYGITEDRLLRLRTDHQYVFTELHVTSDIWSTPGMNPQVMQAMRNALPAGVVTSSAPRIAVLRRNGHTRNISNALEVADSLMRKGFVIPEISQLSFIEQIGLFLEAELVFGIQGSGLIGLIYAQPETRVVTAAPATWSDSYFHGIIQLKEGWHADLRGPSLWNGAGLERDAPFLVPTTDIDEAIDLMRQSSDDYAPQGLIMLGDRKLPRRLGALRIALSFAEGGNAVEFLGCGWSVQESRHVWALGSESTLNLPDISAPNDLVFEMDVVALTVEDHLISRPLSVEVNGHYIDSFHIRNVRTVFCHVPAEYIRGHHGMSVKFGHPLYVSQRITGHGPDDRPTAIGFLELRVYDLAVD